MKPLSQLSFYFILFTCFVQTANAQTTDSKIWVQVDPNSALPEKRNGQFYPSSDLMAELFNRFQVTNYKQAFPHSKKANLKQVYEITCECDQYDFLTAIEKEAQGHLSQAEPAPVYTPLYAPDDYYLTFEEDYALDMIGAQEAWDVTTGDSSVEIAITDTNFDLDHSELAGTVSHTELPLTHPNIYHGTAVAIAAAGNSDNGIGKSSIGSDCTLQLYSMGYDNILAASYNGARIINISWSATCSYSIFAQEVINEAYENGSILVAAAGNGETCGGPGNYVYPASYDHVFSVTSIGPLDNHERFPGDSTSTHQHNDKVDYCAPGYDVALTVHEGWYLTGNGSSFATPYVSGTIGLMLSVNPCLTYEQIEFILDSTSAPIDILNPAYAGLLGEGQIHAAKAVLMAAEFANFNIALTTTHGCTPESASATFIPIPAQGTPPYTVLWDNGTTDFTAEGITPGMHTIEVVDSNGCQSKDSIEVTASTALLLNETLTHLSCAQERNGSIELEISGGMAPYSANWSFDTTEMALDHMAAGDYWVIVTDVNGCETIEHYTLESPEILVASHMVVHDYANTQEGTIDLSIFGGVIPYTINWCTGDSTESVSELSTGSYTYQITDNNGCLFTDSVIVLGKALALSISTEERSPIALYPNPSSNGSITIDCGNEQFTLIEIKNPAGQTVYTQNVASGIITLSTESFAAGVYTVTALTKVHKRFTQKLVITN